MARPILWRQLSPEEARAHPGYGLRGWLGLAEALNLLLLIIMGFACLSAWSGAASAELAGETAPAGAMRIYLALFCLCLLLVALALRLKRPLSPALIAGILGLLEILTLAYDLTWPPLGMGLGWTLLSHIASTALTIGAVRWLLYGFGPNLTFRHRIRAHEEMTDAP